MSYERKTIDVWWLMVDYGQGWEYECAEFTLAEAKKTLREYRENCLMYPSKIVKRREPYYWYYFYGGNDLFAHRPSAGLIRQELDPEGKFKVVYVYGRQLSLEEIQKGKLTSLGEEPVSASKNHRERVPPT